MKTDIKSAELKLYNANSRGNHTGDCVKRAMSLAFDISYNEMSKLLVQKMKERRADKWNRLSVFSRVIEDLGGGKEIEFEGPDTTVDQFADDHPEGIYILLTGEKPGKTSHLVTIRDGKVWDSWNSKRYYVTSYWKIDASNRKEIRDSGKDFMNAVCKKYAIPIVHNELIRYMTKKKWDYSEASNDVTYVSDYQIFINVTIRLNKDELLDKTRYYSFDVKLVVEPTWTEEEIIASVEKNAKQKTYDRMWTINEQEKHLREEYEMRNQVDKLGTGGSSLWITAQEDKFLRTLPGWVRPLVQYISIQNPGMYPDSYQIRLKKLPGDTTHPDDDSFYFEAETASDMREMLLEYKNNGRVEGVDYFWWDEH